MIVYIMLYVYIPGNRCIFQNKIIMTSRTSLGTVTTTLSVTHSGPAPLSSQTGLHLFLEQIIV